MPDRGFGMTDHENRQENVKPTEIFVNGKRINSDINCRLTLAEFLRETLGLTGTKVDCNRGECGSCTVLLDGNPVYACTVLAVEASGRQVITIEGLTGGIKPHLIHEVFFEEFGPGCGYCMPGIIMSTKALLEKNPTPSVSDVIKALDGNLCRRCGSDPGIIEAALAVCEKVARLEAR